MPYVLLTLVGVVIVGAMLRFAYTQGYRAGAKDEARARGQAFGAGGNGTTITIEHTKRHENLPEKERPNQES